VSTMYRILRSHHQVRERRRQASHPAHVKQGGSYCGRRLQIQWSEMVDADDHRRVIVTRLGLAVGDGVELEDPVLGFEVRVVRLLERFDHLTRHALLTEQDPKALMADFVDHPLSDQELIQLAE
jgi:hypothetical protein